MEPVPGFCKKNQFRTLNLGNHTPPRLARRLLLSFLREDLAEEVTGDLEEQFYSTLQKTSLRKARLNYWYQVFHYIRPFAIRKTNSVTTNHYDMFRNYFKIAWRSMTRQKAYSAIKIGGFAFGIAACFLIALFIKDELSYDSQYAKADRIYRVLREFEWEGKLLRGAAMQAPFAKAIKNEFPGIEKSGRLMPYTLFDGAGSNQLRRTEVKENSFEEGFVYADQDWLDIMELPMVYGSRSTALAEPGTMVISKRKADKYFPNENPVGKTMILNNDAKNTIRIGGVMENMPSNMHVNFDFIITLTNKELYKGEGQSWRSNNHHTYLLLEPGVDAAQLSKKMDGIITKYWIPNFIENGGNQEIVAAIKKTHYVLQPVTDIYLRSLNSEDNLSHGDIKFVWLFGAIAVFILAIACINFINLSTAKSANRAKEVGLRKVVGSLRTNLIKQFLTESFLFSFLSFLLGIALAWALLPWFNSLSAKSLSLPWQEWWLAPMLIGVSLVIGLLAGLYPAFYLSAFKPIHVLKGKISRGSKSSVTRSTLVVVQFATSIILIAGTLVIYRQMNFIMNKKIGFDKDQVLLIQGTGTLGDQQQTFKNELLKIPGIKFASKSDYLPITGSKRNNNGFVIEGKQNVDKPVYKQIWRVDHDYIRTMGIKIVDGRDFDVTMPTDSLAIIISQKMAKDLGLEKPVGARITNGNVWTVIGVMEDFHSENMKSDIEGNCFVIGRGNAGIISAKVNSTNMPVLIASVEKLWKKFSPNQAFRYDFLDEQFARMYDDVKRAGGLFSSFSILAVIIACLGLFALSAFMVQQRSKEISIRLVLGASAKSIFRLLTQNFMLLVLISIVIAIPIAWYMMNGWLQDFTYRIDITWDIFLWTAFIAVLIALLTISQQAIRAALADPVKNLRET
jgi:putative ABC transport system permease protein